MKVVTALTGLRQQDPRPFVFLGGGITNCPWWQDEVITDLEEYPFGTLLNPRRRDFPIDDPNAAQAQMLWEAGALHRSSIVSMWFCGGESDQPICMYELGRHLYKHQLGRTRVVLGVDPEYKRAHDVELQTWLVDPNLEIADTLEEHAENIRFAVEAWYETN
jgi:hypothetical protein